MPHSCNLRVSYTDDRLRRAFANPLHPVVRSIQPGALRAACMIHAAAASESQEWMPLAVLSIATGLADKIDMQTAAGCDLVRLDGI